MIITKTPFRISFCGGGSDMPDFYRLHDGCVLSTSINKYMYISIHPYFDEDRIALKYSENETVDCYGQIRHSIFRQVLADENVKGVEITSTADIPSGTGLGSSSSFTVGLLHTISCYKGKYRSKAQLAADACRVEIEKLSNPIGKQDQYAAAFGGLNFISFHKDDTVSVEPVFVKKEILQALQENLLMLYTGHKHNANTILSEQKANISETDKIRNLTEMCNLTKELRTSLETDDLSNFGKLLHENWILKKSLAKAVSNAAIDDMYQTALKNGAIGGKILGAGGGGFLLLYCERERQEKLVNALGLRRFDFCFEREGTSVVYIGDKYW